MSCLDVLQYAGVKSIQVTMSGAQVLVVLARKSVSVRSSDPRLETANEDDVIRRPDAMGIRPGVECCSFREGCYVARCGKRVDVVGLWIGVTSAPAVTGSEPIADWFNTVVL